MLIDGGGENNAGSFLAQRIYFVIQLENGSLTEYLKKTIKFLADDLIVKPYKSFTDTKLLQSYLNRLSNWFSTNKMTP